MTLAQQWENDGYHKGMQQGALTGERAILKRLLTRRFGIIPSAFLEKIENADNEIFNYYR